jgi:hypothetical protein
MVYGISLAQLLTAYGLDLDNTMQIVPSLELPRTGLIDSSVYDPERPVPFPFKADAGICVDSTNLLSAMLRGWSDVPIAAIAAIIPQKASRSVCGYIGARDHTMSPLMRPGSFVVVDDSQRKVLSQEWRTEYHRPIYFLETRNEYCCGWAELRSGLLVLVPHPLSGCATREWPYPGEVEVIGRATAVATRLNDVKARAHQAARP